MSSLAVFFAGAFAGAGGDAAVNVLCLMHNQIRGAGYQNRR